MYDASHLTAVGVLSLLRQSLVSLVIPTQEGDEGLYQRTLSMRDLRPIQIQYSSDPEKKMVRE